MDVFYKNPGITGLNLAVEMKSDVEQRRNA